MSGALIALDWGTTNVRAALLSDQGEVLDERYGESGVGHLDADGFAARFAKLTAGWTDLPSIACGMIGSKQGWKEADYLPCPTGIAGLADGLTIVEHGPAIVAGLKMDTAERRDVMRGEETQIAGLLADDPSFSGTIVLPGTHSKWVRVEKATVETFQTYMTGEMFSALARHTILRHSVDMTDAEPLKKESAEKEFRRAVGDVLVTKGSDMRRFFALRADMLLADVENAVSRERLSGILIGMELAAATQDGFDTQDITLIGDPALTERYASAANVLRADIREMEGSALVYPALYSIAMQAELMETKK